MGQSIRLTGMVLSAAPIGEYDKRMTLLTKERGKISAFARGARRPGSQLLASVNPFSFGKFEAYEGRNSYTVVKADISNYFREVTEDMASACYGFYFLEVADYYARENANEVHMLKLLYQSMRALGNGRLDNRLVRRVFELRAMAANGEYPDVFSCRGCRDDQGPFWLSVKDGGVYCQNCRGARPAIGLDAATLYAMQYILTSSIEKLYTFTVSEEVLETLGRVMDAWMGAYVDRKFHALEILRENEGFAREFLENPRLQ